MFLWKWFSFVWNWLVTGFKALVRVLNVKETYLESKKVWSDLCVERSIADPPADATMESLISRLSLRLMIALAFSELIGTFTISPIMAAVCQYAPNGNWLAGVLGGIAGDYFGAVLSFWFAWWLLCFRYYTEGGMPRVIRFAGDVWYLHAWAAFAAIFLYSGDLLVTFGAHWLVSLINPEVSDQVPVMVWFGFGNSLFEVLYMMAAAGFVPKCAKWIAPSYRRYLSRKQ